MGCESSAGWGDSLFKLLGRHEGVHTISQFAEKLIIGSSAKLVTNAVGSEGPLVTLPETKNQDLWGRGKMNITVETSYR